MKLPTSEVNLRSISITLRSRPNEARDHLHYVNWVHVVLCASALIRLGWTWFFFSLGQDCRDDVVLLSVLIRFGCVCLPEGGLKTVVDRVLPQWLW